MSVVRQTLCRREQQFLGIVGRAQAVRPAGEIALCEIGGRNVPGFTEAGL
jgi:hypothetical protein